MKIIKSVLLSALLFSFMTITAAANSGPSYWQGTDSTGIIITEADCPLTVEKEILTFDIFTLPKDYYYEKEELSGYNSSLTADYTFKNPKNYDITATLAFPIGTLPDYLGYDSSDFFYDNDTYGVSVESSAVNTDIRYTYFPYGSEFDYKTELLKLSDNYMEDDFFSPDMPVTKYIFAVSGVNQDSYPVADIAFIWNNANNPGTRIYFESASGYSWNDSGSARLSAGIGRGEEIALYAIGNPLSVMPEFNCYENGETDATVIDGQVQLVGTEQTTLLQLLKENVNKYYKIPVMSDIDLYNIFIDDFNRQEQDYYAKTGIIDINSYIFNYLMCWYVYDITIPAGGTLSNTVTAPLFPAIHLNMEPDTFCYTYLLSPAQSWAEFGPIEININTPFYMLENSLQGFKKTYAGYSFSADTLPDGELEFTLCSVENPKKEKYTGIYSRFGWSLFIVTLLLAAVGYYFIKRKSVK